MKLHHSAHCLSVILVALTMPLPAGQQPAASDIEALLNDLNQASADNEKLGNGSLPNASTERKP